MTLTDQKQKLKSVEDVKRYFAENKIPYYFVSASNFNLMGLEQWVNNFQDINFIDAYDGNNPSVLVPQNMTQVPFDSIESINHYLLSHKETVDRLERDRKVLSSNDPNSRIVFLFLNNETESICGDLELDICLPPADLIKIGRAHV